MFVIYINVGVLDCSREYRDSNSNLLDNKQNHDTTNVHIFT
jgi:hypothetical protein